MAGRGGARPGAGRKPRAEKHATPIADAEGRIAQRLPQLLDNLFALADGVKVQKADGTAYTTVPCRQSNEYLINRVLGKPIDRKEVSGPDGNAIPVSVESAIERIYGTHEESH